MNASRTRISAAPRRIALTHLARIDATVQRVSLEMKLSVRMWTSVQSNRTTVIRMPFAKTPLVLITAAVVMDTVETASTARTSTNALCRLTGVIQMQVA